MIEQIEELNGQINVSGNVVGTIIGQNCSGGGGSGGGDMYKAVYDTNDNGIVDNAEKVNNHTVLSDVPANAVFTDTTYTAGTGIDITNGVISNTQTSAEWGNISGNLSDQIDLKNVLDSKANSSSIPTKISDLTNDSDFIETSQTSGLIKNDGTIDTTSYSTFSGNYNDLSNKPTIPTKTSDLTNDSKFKPITVDENFPSNPAKNDLCVQKHYNTVLESIGVGDNLNGVTLDLGFPEMDETPIMFEDPYTSSYNYNTEYPIIESSKYAITFWHGNVTGFGYIEVIQVKNKDLNQTIAELYWASETTIETTRQSYTLPSDFGNVTGIDNVIGVYPYIKKIIKNYNYADYHYYDGSDWEKIGEKEISISDTEPLDPEEDDLWIDTSEPEEIQEAIKNEYSESTSDTYSCDYINGTFAELTQGNLTTNDWTINYRKKGNVVMINIYNTSTITVDGYATITLGTMPSGLRPLIETTMAGLIYENTKTRIYVETGGAIKLFNWDAQKSYTSGSINVNVTYLV